MLSKRLIRVASTVAVGLVGFPYLKQSTLDKEKQTFVQILRRFPRISFPKVHAELTERFLKDFKDINEATGLSFTEIGKVDLLYYVKNNCQRFYFLEYEDFFLCYDAEKKNPAFTYEHLTPDSFKMKKKLGFKRKDGKSNNSAEDHRLPSALRVPANDDFYPFARGHLISMENHRGSNKLFQIYTTTNYLPQDRSLRQNGWKYLEEFTKELTCKFKDVYIVTGPLYIYGPDCPASKSRVGSLGSEVPTDFFKIVIIRERGEDDFDDQYHIMAFMMPNSDSCRENGDLYVNYLSRYLVPVQLIEDALGFKLFPKGLQTFTTVSPCADGDFNKQIKNCLPGRCGRPTAECSESEVKEGACGCGTPQ